MKSPGNPATLVDGMKTPNPEYDDLVTIEPSDNPMEGSEEASPDEQAHLDNMYADFMDALYTKGEQPVLQMIKTAPDLYSGVAQAAFTILRGVFTQYKQKEGEVPGSVLFSEGGMINTAVDEVFAMAKTNGLEKTDDMNQYMAAQIDMMRRVGEYMEQIQDDDAVEQAQDLLADMELAYNPNVDPGAVAPEERQNLEALEYQDEAIAEAQAGPAPEQSMPPPAEGGGMLPPEAQEGFEEQMPPSGPNQGGLI